MPAVVCFSACMLGVHGVWLYPQSTDCLPMSDYLEALAFTYHSTVHDAPRDKRTRRVNTAQCGVLMVSAAGDNGTTRA